MAQQGWQAHAVCTTDKSFIGYAQFEHTRKLVDHLGIIFNTPSWDEHFPEIERYIRIIKESLWVTVNTLSFEQYPNRLIAERVYNAVNMSEPEYKLQQ